VSLLITLEEVVDLIKHEARGKIGPGTVIGADAKLKDLGLSSLQIAEIVFTLEENHEVEFDPARAADAVSLGDLIALGNSALAEQASR
jgi:acyl carrier protein